MGCYSGNDEERLILNVLQDEFRRGRKAEDFQNHKLLKQILKHICATVCLYKPSGWRLIVGIFVSMICIFQFVFFLATVCGCPNFDCSTSGKWLGSDQYVNGSAPDLKALPADNVLLSISGLFSYNLLLISLWNMYRRLRQGKEQAISPSDALFNDLSNTQVKYIFLSQITITTFFIFAVVSVVVMNYQRISSTDYYKYRHYYLLIIGSGSAFVAMWAATVGCYAFAISCLALGTFANDTVRRIKEIGKESKKGRKDNRTTGEKPLTSQAEKINEGGNPESGLSAENIVRCTYELDLAFEYHEELCVIVSDTVSAYRPWFVMHWLCYGATCLIEVIFVSTELKFWTRSGLSVAEIGVILVVILHLFLFPCICAAYITDTCGGISARVNATTSKDWHEDHLFRDRAKLMMFTAYAKDRQCVFKIGRLTLTPTLAWISLLLGSTGILYHVFEQ